MLESPLARQRPNPSARTKQASTTAADRIGRCAVRALYHEVALAPKPGLVSPTDNGSHRDMNFQTFIRSLVALRDYFPTISACGATQPSFAELQALGIAAEHRMLAATGGVNTHRGAIFNLGLLSAAAGWHAREGWPLVATALCRLVSERWGVPIRASLALKDGPQATSHGLTVARRYGSGGARAEAADGFPAAIDIGLPAYRAALAAGGDGESAAVQALFALIAALDDSNLLWRGGPSGLRHAQEAAAGFLDAGGVFTADWRARAAAIHRDFVRRNLSPGGSADLLGVTLFLHAIEAE